MHTRITESKDRTYPTRIPLKAMSGSPLGLAVYVQNISDNTINLKLKGQVTSEEQVIKDLTFGGLSYEEVYPGVCCLFMDKITMPKFDITLCLTSYYWRLGEWVEDSIREYDIVAVLPPPPPPEFTDISLSFSEA